MFDQTEKYKNWGHFFFTTGSDLKDLVKDIPNKPGVYYFLRLAGGSIDLIYISKSDLTLGNRTEKESGLREQINGNQEGLSRQAFLEKKMKEEQIEAIDIYWFVTMDEKHNDLPSFVEGTLIQQYYEIYGELPHWNRNY